MVDKKGFLGIWVSKYAKFSQEELRRELKERKRLLRECSPEKKSSIRFFESHIELLEEELLSREAPKK